MTWEGLLHSSPSFTHQLPGPLPAGNFADGRKTFDVINYDDPAQFAEEREYIRWVGGCSGGWVLGWVGARVHGCVRLEWWPPSWLGRAWAVA